MHESLIQNWNEKVKKEDIVYHLGDFAFASIEKSSAILNRLNGHKISIFGNHDSSKTRMEKVGFDEVYPYLQLTDNIYLCHYKDSEDKTTKGSAAMFISSITAGSILLHGHMHSKPEDKMSYDGVLYTYDVGVDANDYTPVELDTILKEIDVNFGNTNTN